MRRFIKDWEPRALTALIAATVAAWITVVLIIAVSRGSLTTLDHSLLRWLRTEANGEVMRGPWWMAEVVRDLSALGSVSVLSLGTAGIAGFLWMSGRRDTSVFLVVAVFSGMLMSIVLKSLIDRPRPDIVPHLSDVATSSFPSGHSMMAAVVFLTLGSLLMTTVQEWWLKAYILGVAIAATLLVGLSRILLGVHYPSDVAAGWTVGVLWSEGCWLAHAYFRRRIRKDLPGNSPHAPAR
jgi:undecaprenyl-diphosphatase